MTYHVTRWVMPVLMAALVVSCGKKSKPGGTKGTAKEVGAAPMEPGARATTMGPRPAAKPATDTTAGMAMIKLGAKGYAGLLGVVATKPTSGSKKVGGTVLVAAVDAKAKTPGAVQAARVALLGKFAKADVKANRAKVKKMGCRWKARNAVAGAGAGAGKIFVCAGGKQVTGVIPDAHTDAYERVVVIGEQPRAADFIPVVGSCGFLFTDPAGDRVHVQCPSNQRAGPLTVQAVQTLYAQWSKALQYKHQAVMSVIKRMPNGDFSVTVQVYQDGWHKGTRKR